MEKKRNFGDIYNEISCLRKWNWRLLAQDQSEWKSFLEFVDAYFRNRGIENPIVVEIGLMHNAQKEYYVHLFNAEHIGIDCNVNAMPDILGNSRHPDSMEMLELMLKGRKIDLLFIDGDHSFEAVKGDYELYGPLTKHLVAFHDIRATNNSEVYKFWDEIKEKNTTIEFNRYNDYPSIKEGKFIDMGIGLIIKE